jgi:hypothetical protein
LEWRLAPQSASERGTLAPLLRSLDATVDSDAAHGSVAMPYDRHDPKWYGVLDALAALREAIPGAPLRVRDSFGLVGWNPGTRRYDLEPDSERDPLLAVSAPAEETAGPAEDDEDDEEHDKVEGEPLDDAVRRLTRIVEDRGINPDAACLAGAIRALACSARGSTTTGLLCWRARHDRLGSHSATGWRADLIRALRDLGDRAVFDTLILELAVGYAEPPLVVEAMLATDIGRALGFARRALGVPGVARVLADHGGEAFALLAEEGRSAGALNARSQLELLTHRDDEVRANACRQLTRSPVPEHLLAMALVDSLSKAIERRAGRLDHARVDWRDWLNATRMPRIPEFEDNPFCHQLTEVMLARRHELVPQRLTPELEEILELGADAIAERYVARPVLVTDEERARADEAEQALIARSGR